MRIIKIKKGESEDFAYPEEEGEESELVIGSEDIGAMGIKIRSNGYRYRVPVMEFRSGIGVGLTLNYRKSGQGSSINSERWRWNYDQRIKNAGERREYYDGEGQRHVFLGVLGSAERYIDSSQSTGYELEEDLNGYRIYDIEKNRMEFDRAGYLIKIIRIGSKKNRTIEIIRDEHHRIVRISNGRDADIKIEYQSRKIIVGNGNETRTIGTDGNNDIVTIEDERDGRITRYIYGQDGLSEVIGPDVGVVLVRDCTVKHLKLGYENGILNEMTLNYGSGASAYEKKSVKIRKYGELYEVIQRTDGIKRKDYYSFRADGSIEGQYESYGDEEEYAVILERMRDDRNSIRAMKSYDYIEKKVMPEKRIDGNGKFSVALIEGSGAVTDVYSLTYDFIGTVKEKGSVLILRIIRNGETYASQTQELELGEDRNICGTMQYILPEGDRDGYHLEIETKNKKGYVTPKEVRIYAQENRYGFVVTTQQNSSNHKYQIHKEDGTEIETYRYNGMVYLNGAVCEVSGEELKRNLRNCHKAIESRNSDFLFYYGRFKYGMMVNTGTMIGLLNENGQGTGSLFCELRIFDMEKNGTTKIFTENEKEMEKRHDIILNEQIGKEIHVKEGYCDIDKGILQIERNGASEIVYEYDDDENRISSEEKKLINGFADPKERILYQSKYDTMGRMTESISHSKAGIMKTEYGYDERSRIISTKDGQKQEIKYSYNDFDCLTRVISAEEEHRMIFQHNHDLRKMIASTGVEIDLEYDEKNTDRIDKILLNGEVFESYIRAIDDRGREETVVYPSGEKRIEKYDEYGHLIGIDKEREGQRESCVTYIYFDEIKGATTYLGIDDPLDEDLIRSRSSKLRKILKKTEKGTRVYVPRYDELGKLREIEELGSSTTHYKYDEEGRLRVSVWENGSEFYNVEMDYQRKIPMREENLSMLAVTYTKNQKRYSYQETLDYDSYGRRVGRKGTVLEYGYEYERFSDSVPIIKKTNDQLGRITVTYEKEILLDEQVTYDLSGNITRIGETNQVQYEYDSMNRLTQEKDNDGNRRIEYIYLTNGQLSQKVIYSSFTGLEVERTKYAYSRTDRMIGCNDIGITYDIAGNMASYGTKRYRYTDGHRLAAVYDSEGETEIRFTYDEETGRRTRMEKWRRESLEESRGYIYHGNLLIYEDRIHYDQGQIMQSDRIVYLHGVDGVEGMIYREKTYHFVKDILGNIRMIISETGEIVARYRYTAFGTVEILLDQNGIGRINPFLYRGYYYDDSTGLFYCNSRYYSPELCRWISPDDISYLDPETIGGMSLYTYCANNPVNYSDGSGHFPITAMLITGLIMGISMVAFQGVSDLATYTQTGNWDHVVWQDYVGNFVGGFIGGALSVVLTSGLAASLAATGFSRMVSMELQNATGDANYSTWDIVKDVGISMLVTTITYGLTYGIGNRMSGNNYFKTYSDLPYLFGQGLTKGVEKSVVKQFMYQYIVMTMNMGLIASFGDYIVGYKWKNKLIGAI